MNRPFSSLLLSSLILFCLTIGPSPANEPIVSTHQQEKCVRVPDLSGRWSGYWESDETGHTGPIKARIERIDCCHYRVVYCGRFWKVLPFRYVSELNVTGYGNGSVCLSGSERLGPLMGTFSYNAWASSSKIVLCYRSRKDQGRFVMTRRCD